MNKRLFKPRPTTRLERGLMAGMVVLWPLENNFLIGGYSLTFILFGILTLFALIRHPSTLVRTLTHPVFLIAFLFVLGGFIAETFHLNSDHEVIDRTMKTFLGGAVLASYCRDMKAMRAVLYSFLIMGIGVGLYLILSVFGVLSAATATDISTASMVRYDVFEDRYLLRNLNAMAHLVGLGAAVALLMWATAQKRTHRIWLMTVFLICLTAVFLPMSRSGIFMIAVLCALILFLRGLFRLRTLVLGLATALVILLVVPDVVFYRMSFAVESNVTPVAQSDARASVLLASLEAISEEPLLGIGAGNFWGEWGVWSSFYAASSGKIVGSHNAYAQIIIYWGVMLALIWGLLFWVIYRRLPQPFGDNRVSLFLFTLFVWVFLVSMFTHTIYSKVYALAFGVIVGFDRWIRPTIDWKSLRTNAARQRVR